MYEIKNKNISVIITDFNRMNYINYALSSLPIDNDIETILVTNIEEDKIKNDKIKMTYIYNKGETYGDMLRVAIQESKGDIICFLEDDDIFSPDKIKYIKKIFNSSPETSYYHNSYFRIDDFGKQIGIEQNKEKISFLPFKNSKELKKIMNRNVDHNLSSITVNKRYINSSELVTLSRINLSVDTYMFAISLKEGTKLIDDNSLLTGYRIHDSTSNPNKKTSPENPYLRLHEMYSKDYKISSNITENSYFKDFLNCRYKIEKLYYSAHRKRHILQNTIDCLPCIKYLDIITIKNRVKMFIK